MNELTKVETTEDVVEEIKPKKKKKKKNKKQSRETTIFIDILTIVRNALIIFVLYSLVAIFLISPIRIDGSSMYPTYRNGTWGISNATARYGRIRRFDVVVVYNAKEEKYIIKRVIGLPNETIQVSDNRLYIDGIRYDEEYLDEDYMIQESMKNNESFTTDFGPVKLGDDEYFIMGDNRPISKDSRSYGAIHKSDIRSVGFKILIDGNKD